MRAPLSDRGAMLGSGLGVSQCAPLGGVARPCRVRTTSFDAAALQMVTISHSPSLNISGDWSIAAWVTTTGLQVGYPCILSRAFPPSVPYTLGFESSTKRLRVGIYNGNWFTVAGNTPLVDWRPHHVMGIHRDATLEIWISGRLDSVGGGPVGTPVSTTGLRLGRRWDQPDYVNAMMDGVRLYNRALPAYEIAEHYRGIYSNNEGLVGRWDLDEADGLIAYDKSGYGNHGTLVGAPQRVQVFRPDRLP